MKLFLLLSMAAVAIAARRARRRATELSDDDGSASDDVREKRVDEADEAAETACSPGDVIEEVRCIIPACEVSAGFTCIVRGDSKAGDETVSFCGGGGGCDERRRDADLRCCSGSVLASRARAREMLRTGEAAVLEAGVRPTTGRALVPVMYRGRRMLGAFASGEADIVVDCSTEQAASTPTPSLFFSSSAGAVAAATTAGGVPSVDVAADCAAVEAAFTSSSFATLPFHSASPCTAASSAGAGCNDNSGESTFSLLAVCISSLLVPFVSLVRLAGFLELAVSAVGAVVVGVAAGVFSARRSAAAAGEEGEALLLLLLSNTASNSAGAFRTFSFKADTSTPPSSLPPSTAAAVTALADLPSGSPSSSDDTSRGGGGGGVVDVTGGGGDDGDENEELLTEHTGVTGPAGHGSATAPVVGAPSCCDTCCDETRTQSAPSAEAEVGGSDGRAVADDKAREVDVAAPIGVSCI